MGLLESSLRLTRGDNPVILRILPPLGLVPGLPEVETGLPEAERGLPDAGTGLPETGSGLPETKSSPQRLSYPLWG